MKTAFTFSIAVTVSRSGSSEIFLENGLCTFDKGSGRKYQIMTKMIKDFCDFFNSANFAWGQKLCNELSRYIFIQKATF